MLHRCLQSQVKQKRRLCRGSTSSGNKRKHPFDPTSECCVQDKQKKKKAATTKGRVTNVQVILLKCFTPSLPRGRRRTELKDSGRIKMLQFKRSMSPHKVRSQIVRGFHHIKGLETLTYLDSRDNNLKISKKKDLGGEDVIKRKGSLYLYSSSKRDVSDL